MKEYLLLNAVVLISKRKKPLSPSRRSVMSLSCLPRIPHHSPNQRTDLEQIKGLDGETKSLHGATPEDTTTGCHHGFSWRGGGGGGGGGRGGVAGILSVAAKSCPLGDFGDDSLRTPKDRQSGFTVYIIIFNWLNNFFLEPTTQFSKSFLYHQPNRFNSLKTGFSYHSPIYFISALIYSCYVPASPLL